MPRTSVARNSTQRTGKASMAPAPCRSPRVAAVITGLCRHRFHDVRYATGARVWRPMRSLADIGVAVALAGMALAVATERARAQAQDYPNRAVSFIVPFAPGGVTSVFARLIGT